MGACRFWFVATPMGLESIGAFICCCFKRNRKVWLYDFNHALCIHPYVSLHQQKGYFMKHDIQNKNDIIQLVDTFYDKVKADALIGHFFSEVMKVNWEKHLPKMYNFWDNVVFYTNNYSGNPMQVHKNIHALHPFTGGDFKQWYQLFVQTVDELFEGDNAALIKQRALSIATIMQIKIVAAQEIHRVHE